MKQAGNLPKINSNNLRYIFSILSTLDQFVKLVLNGALYATLLTARPGNNHGGAHAKTYPLLRPACHIQN
jgi:hypothetical protein